MENIQVALRVRPLSQKECDRGEENIWKITQNNTISLQPDSFKDMISTKKINFSSRISFPFDHVFSSEDDNLQVYNTMVKRIALSSLNGINGTVFMYGQTGSGKTYTMMGYKQEETHNSATNGIMSTYGIIPTSPKLQQKIGYFKSATCSEDKLANDNLLGEDCIEMNNKPIFLTNDAPSTGILIQALRDIFSAIENDLDKTYFLRCSYVEIYNDQIYDLLKSHDKLNETLTVNEDPKRDFYIKGVTEESVSSISEILNKLKKGETNRHYAATMMNHSSSRSHTIFRLSVQTVTNNFIRDYRRECFKKAGNENNDDPKTEEGSLPEGFTNINVNIFSEEALKREGTMVTESLLNFVDLAGSEKVSNHHVMFDDSSIRELLMSEGSFHGKDLLAKTANIKDRVKEGQYINKSLFFLTQVISLKSEGKPSQHIPYRNSPLTKILRSSLGGNSRTLIILCVTPASSQLDQSISTLRFGMNAKKIENKVQANIITNNDDEALKIIIADYEKKILDFENNRQEEQQKTHLLVKQIEDLQQQKIKLIERLNNLSKIQLNKFAESISDNELRKFFEQVQDRFIYFDRVGILFTSSRLNKYDQFNTKSKNKGDYSPFQKRNSIYALSNKRKSRKSSGGISNLYSDDGDIQNIKNNQDLIYDSQGKFALLAFRSIKRQNKALLKKISVLEEIVKKNVEEALGNYDSLLEYAHRYQILNKKLKEFSDGLCNEIDKNTQLKKELDLYKELKGINDLPDSELLDMEKNFLDKIDDIKSERALRNFKKEINNLRSLLNIPIIDDKKIQNESEHQNYMRKDLIKNELQDEESDDILRNINKSLKIDTIDINDFESTKPEFFQAKQKSIWDEYSNLIDPINKEIDDASKSTDDYETSISVTIVPKQPIDNLNQEHVENNETIEEKNDIEDQKPLSLDIGLSIADYDININKYSQDKTNNIEIYQQIELMKEIEYKDTFNNPEVDSMKEIDYRDTPDHSAKLEIEENTPQKDFNDIVEDKPNEIEYNPVMDSTINLTSSKQASPLYKKKNSLDGISERSSHDHRYMRANSASVKNTITKDNTDKFYSSASKSNLLKLTMKKSIIPSNTPTLPKSKTKSQSTIPDYLSARQQNSANSITNKPSSRKVSQSPLDKFIPKNKNLVPVYFHSLTKKDNEGSGSMQKSDSRNKLHIPQKKINDRSTEGLTDRIQDPEKLNDNIIDQILTGRSSKIDEYEFIKMNKDYQHGESKQIGLSIQGIDPIDNDESNISNCMSAKQLQMLGNLDIDISKLNPSFCSNTFINSHNNSDSSSRGDFADFYLQQSIDQDNRKRRSRAERAGKNK